MVYRMHTLFPKFTSVAEMKFVCRNISKRHMNSVSYPFRLSHFKLIGCLSDKTCYNEYVTSTLFIVTITRILFDIL